MDYGENLSPSASKSWKQKYCKFPHQNFVYINLATLKSRSATRKSQSSHNGFISVIHREVPCGLSYWPCPK